MNEANVIGAPKLVESLLEKTLNVKSRLICLSDKSDEIHGALFGTQPSSCENTDGPGPKPSLESVLHEISKIITELEDSLGDTQRRL